MDDKMILDYTTLSDFLTCRKKYYWRHQRQLAPIEKPAAPTFGHACHTAWAVYYRGGSVEDALKAFEDEYKDFEVPEGDKRTMELGLKVLKDYFKRYAHNPFKVIDVEVSHKVEISDALTYAARIDTIIDWGGRIYVMEHKTTSALGARFFDQFKLCHQVDGYVFACEDKYGKCDGVLIDACLVAKTKFNCLRDIVGRDEGHSERFREELQEIARNIEWANKHKSYIQNKGACDYYGQCIYKDLCRYGEKAIGSRYQEAIWDAGEGKVVTEK